MPTFTLTDTLTDQPVWVNRKEGARLAEVREQNMAAAVRAGAIRVRNAPGSRARYLREDCIALCAPPAPRAVPTA
jgi:hypothetical protein